MFVGGVVGAGESYDGAALREAEEELGVSAQPEEVAWYAFLTDEELDHRIPEWEWVPDGLEAYRRLREHRPAP